MEVYDLFDWRRFPCLFFQHTCLNLFGKCSRPCCHRIRLSCRRIRSGVIAQGFPTGWCLSTSWRRLSMGLSVNGSPRPVALMG